jgi:hypothetical protein
MDYSALSGLSYKEKRDKEIYLQRGKEEKRKRKAYR